MSDPSSASPGPASAPCVCVRVVAGSPNEEEVAALAVVLLARSSAPVPSRPPQATTAWNQPARRMQPPVRRGPDAWRRSALPR